MPEQNSNTLDEIMVEVYSEVFRHSITTALLHSSLPSVQTPAAEHNLALSLFD